MTDTNENSAHEAFLDALDEDTRRVVAYFIDGEITALGYPSTRNGSKVFEQAQATALDTIINRELDLSELSSDILASIDAEGDNDEQRAVQKDTRKRIDSIAAYLAQQTQERAVG